MNDDERQALMDRNLAAARARVEAADDADRAPDAKALTRTEVVRAWCADKPVALKVNGSWLHAMIDARSVECWRPDCDSDSSAHCAGEIIDRIAQALAVRVVTHAPDATEAVRGGVPWISITSMAEAIEARETIATLHSVCETYEADIRSLHSQLATVTKERDEREAARAEADRIACKVFAEQGDLRAQLADAMQERDELRTILALAAQAVNNLAHGTWGSK